MSSALSTDLYEITMAAAYYAHGERGPATFELWVRDLPPGRGYLVAAGLDQALDFLEQVAFTAEEIDYLRTVPVLTAVPGAFFEEFLPSFRFTGEVWALPEGTPVFAGEPLLRVTASLPEAQVVETALLSTVLFQTMVASKASRIVGAAAGRPVVEFGGRRAHGVEAATLAARAAFIAGCAATSNVAAAARFDIPVSGTMAHSWVMAHSSEDMAFRRYADLYGSQTVLVLDTYDTLAAAGRVVAAGLHPAAVRLDSGDLAGLSREVRRILDTGGHQDTRILASGDLDEHRIAALLNVDAPIDGFGVGTALSTSSDAPSLSGVYKLVETERGGATVPTTKRSPEKSMHPGRKQVWRVYRDDEVDHDLVTRHDETVPGDVEPLLQCVMRDGRRLSASPTLAALQGGCRQAVGKLPRRVTRRMDPEPFAVRVSAALEALARQTGVGALPG